MNSPRGLRRGFPPPPTRLQDPKAPPPHWVLVHLSLISAQVIFGVGAVIGKLGVRNFNPILFVGIRDGIGGPLLITSAAALYCRGACVERRDLPRLFCAGFCLYCSQACFIVGENLSSAVIGSAWQPAQPIMTSAIAITLGWEKLTKTKAAGIFVAFVGAAIMVLLQPAPVNTSGSGSDADDGSHSGGSLVSNPMTAAQLLTGNAMFFCNCMGTTMYVILSKPLVQKYECLVVTAWACE